MLGAVNTSRRKNFFTVSRWTSGLPATATVSISTLFLCVWRRRAAPWKQQTLLMIKTKTHLRYLENRMCLMFICFSLWIFMRPDNIWSLDREFHNWASSLYMMGHGSVTQTVDLRGPTTGRPSSKITQMGKSLPSDGWPFRGCKLLLCIHNHPQKRLHYLVRKTFLSSIHTSPHQLTVWISGKRDLLIYTRYTMQIYLKNNMLPLINTHSCRCVSAELCELDAKALLFRHEMPSRMPVCGHSLPAWNASPQTTSGDFEALQNEMI